MTRLTTAFIILTAFAAPSLAGDAGRGRELFRDHCAVCHGRGATGDGPMAPVLAVRPPDLTLLAAQNDGSFPSARVVRRIDGETEVLAHGGPMPLFGLVLEGPSDILVDQGGAEIVAAEAIVDIATYLETLQR